MVVVYDCDGGRLVKNWHRIQTGEAEKQIEKKKMELTMGNTDVSVWVEVGEGRHEEAQE